MNERSKALEDAVENLEPPLRRALPEQTAINAALVRMFARHMPASAKAKILVELERSTNHFAKPDSPGHMIWYPIHLANELFARKLFDDTPR